MNRFRLLIVLSTVVLLASCAAQKRVWYLQDARNYTPEQIAQEGQIRIKPFDRLTIVVNSKDPELAVPFNAASSYNSLTGGKATSTTNAQSLQVLTVDESGCLDLPIIGRIECEGMTRFELSRKIADEIASKGYINELTVNVQFSDMKIAVFGEVARPGEYAINNKERISIFDALALAGDITVYGIRTEVSVLRETNGTREIYFLDLTSKKVFDSPAFYIEQNDQIYVKPNKYKAQAGEISQNRSFYLSLIGTAISVATLIVTLTK